MPKKTKNVPEKKEFLGTIKSLKTKNFMLFEKNEINFQTGFNIINYNSMIDKILFKFIFKICLNPDFRIQNRKIDTEFFNYLENIKIDSKKGLGFTIILCFTNIKKEEIESNFIHNFMVNNELQMEFEINSQKDILLRIFDFSQKKFTIPTPSQEYQLSDILYNNIWLDKTVFPFFNADMITELIKYNHSRLFDFFLALLGFNEMIKQYYKLKENINLTRLEKENFQIIKQQAIEKKADLENELTILKEIEHIDDEINQLELEKNWAGYFDLKSKFQSKSASIEQIDTKLIELQEKKNTLENSIDNYSERLNKLKTNFDETTNQYEQKRREFLSEKASLDKIDRNLKDWGSTVNKAERDLKYKSMKIKDIEKKLKDLNMRIGKNSSKTLLTQKNQLEKELKKDQNELKNLQENLNAIENEKNLKTKEKTIKERKSQSKNIILADLTKKISNYNESISLNEEKVNELTEQLQSVEISLKNLDNEKGVFKKEINEINEKISIEMENLKTKNLEIPKESRSLSTITILQNQLIKQKETLTKRIHPETNESVYSDHLAFIKSFDNEAETRDKQIDFLLKSLSTWEIQWIQTFKNELDHFQNLTNELVSNFDLKLDIFISEHINPDEGAIEFQCSILSETQPKIIWLKELTLVSVMALISIIFSSILVKKDNCYIIDLFEIFNIPSVQLKSFLIEYIAKFNKTTSDSKNNLSQLIIFVSKETFGNLQILDQFDILK